ncbi:MULTISPECIES: CBO0543 family protein [unclassified Sutcliffiella]|uniref:CBO0543 family protein n=1 Tax=unclassified Sutcliffiella TaxID=2837532 RepID=UPI0030CB4A02
MKDKIILQIITVLGLGGWSLLFRKGPIKDWFLVYLFKTFITTLIDGPVTKKKLVTYPYRFLANIFETNIIFDYIIFPLLCVFYSQFTYKMKLLKTIVSVFLFSLPMTVIQEWLERNTQLVKYSRRWSWINTLSVLTMTFWSSRIFIAWIRFINQKRKNLNLIKN